MLQEECFSVFCKFYVHSYIPHFLGRVRTNCPIVDSQLVRTEVDGVSSTSNGGMTERTMLVRSDFFLEGLVLADGTKPKLKGLNQRPSADHAGRREASVAIWTHSRPAKRVDIQV